MSVLIAPLDGELLFISAMTAIVSRRSASLSLGIPSRDLARLSRSTPDESDNDRIRACCTRSPRTPPGGFQRPSACVSGAVRLIFEFGKSSGCRKLQDGLFIKGKI